MENKKRLIDADALIKHLGEEPMVWCDGEAEIQERDDWRRFKAYIEAQDTIDAVEVVHGRWITHNKGQNNWCECSECNTVGSPFWKRCPMCEAKMDGDENG